MTDKMHPSLDMPTDAVLTAFIDGQLPPQEEASLLQQMNEDPQIAARVEFLSRASLNFSAAFQHLLDDAPLSKLQAQLDAIPSTDTPPPRWVGANVNGGRRGFIGLLAASVVAGVFADRVWLATTSGDETDRDDSAAWRAVVAQYMALYTRETLGLSQPAYAQQQAQLSSLNAQLGLSLTPEDIALPHFEFRRAQILAYDSKPLAQILYEDPQGRPMALCILRDKSGAHAVTAEKRQSMTIAWWANRDYQALLIGHGTSRDINTLAESVRERLFSERA
ncbi:anti-sigma factor [Rhizobium sp.]|jgi:anti-sigma factor RsiW|uniref:anti-sigma factor family protein n=1 Tax=Rhizobium sp. TaxID=391 RepID=UPI000E8401D3|nr:Fis family transcriptional regulator [Rhizobium sp.]